MALEKDFEGSNDIAHFLEKFKEQPFSTDTNTPMRSAHEENASSVRPAQYVRSFEKLEQKIHELEERFEASATQNQLILSELARTREVMERQKDKDAFLEHLSRTIATLRTSVENLSHAQEANSFAFRDVPVQRSFDPVPNAYVPTQSGTQTTYTYPTIDTQAQLNREREEQTRLFNSLRQKASQLKAVNSALDREIKKAQQDKLEALKKSTDQAKEILSLRDQLTAAEERFKAFDFEGRIISIKQEYQQKVSTLETQLKEMSDTCMKQVEEIESLKAQNAKLQHATTQKEALQAKLADKEAELNTLKESMRATQAQQSGEHTKRLAVFTAQLRTLEEQRDRLAVELEQSQIVLETVRREKEMLEKNFKELVQKMEKNDVVIGELKQKIDVLGTQNAALTQHNEELTQSNILLTQDNARLSKTNVELTHRNAALTQHNAQLTTHNVTLTRHTESLEGEKASLAKQVQKLHQEKEALKHAQQVEVPVSLAQKPVEPAPQSIPQPPVTKTPQEVPVQITPVSQPVASQSAALLAARLVQEHIQKQRPQAQPKVLVDAAQERKKNSPVVHSLGRTLPSAAEEEWEVLPTKISTGSSAIPLPEIKVADPIEQPDFLEGEDFLEKTGSFIGRMKWSIFHDNH